MALQTIWRYRVANDTTDVVITKSLSDRRPTEGYGR